MFCANDVEWFLAQVPLAARRIKQGDLSVEVRKVAGEVFEVLVIAHTAYHSAYGALLPLCLVW